MLDDCLWRFALLYMDDILIYSKTFEEILLYRISLDKAGKEQFLIEIRKVSIRCEERRLFGIHRFARRNISEQG